MGEQEGKENDEQKKSEQEADGGEKNKGKGGGGGGGGGGEKKKKKKKGGGGGGDGEGGGEKKKDDGPLTVVLKVDMHCEGCAKEVRKSVQGFLGVETVTTDSDNNKLTVVGKVDPWKLRERVETKTRKRVELISPTNVPKKKDETKADGKGKNGDKMPDEKKPKEPVDSTVVLKIRLHCEGCVKRIRKYISRTKGVAKVTVDEEKELVTVEGTMDVKTFVPYLRQKLRREVDVVPSKKVDNKEKGDGGGGGKKDKSGGGGDGEGDKKKTNNKENGNKCDGGEKKQEAAGGKVVENRMEYHCGVGGYLPYNAYQLEMVHAPQIFSDENPNACSVM